MLPFIPIPQSRKSESPGSSSTRSCFWDLWEMEEMSQYFMWRMNICVFIHQLPLLTGRDALEGIKTPHFQAVSVYALIWSLASEGPEVESTDRHSLLEARHCQHESTPVYNCPKHLLLELAVSKGDGTWSDWNVPITVRERSNNATGSILPSPSLWNSL